MVDIEILKEIVKGEVENIKKYASPEEIVKLDPNHFSSDDPTECIYGQMTGDCRSYRAMELIGLCCEKVMSTEGLNWQILTECLLNGKPVPIEDPSKRLEMYVSPLESFIHREKYNNAGEKIIHYLKGKTETLEL